MAPQLSGLRETLALLFSGISYGRSRDSNEIGGTISIHPVIDELSRGYKVVLSIVFIHRFPQGKWTQTGCQCRLALRGVARVARAGSEKSSLRPLIDVEIFLVKNVPLPLSVRCLWRRSQPNAVEIRASTASGRRQLPPRRPNIDGFN